MPEKKRYTDDEILGAKIAFTLASLVLLVILFCFLFAFYPGYAVGILLGLLIVFVIYSARVGFFLKDDERAGY